MIDVCTPGQYAKLKLSRGDTSGGLLEVEVQPQDLQAILEERKKKLQSMIIIKQKE